MGQPELIARWAAARASRVVAGGAFLVVIGSLSIVMAIYAGHSWLFYALAAGVLPLAVSAVRLGLRRSGGDRLAVAVTKAGLDVGMACAAVIPWSRVRGARVVTEQQDHETTRFLCIEVVGAEALCVQPRSLTEKLLSGFVEHEPPLTFFEVDLDVDPSSIADAINERCAGRGS